MLLWKHFSRGSMEKQKELNNDKMEKLGLAICYAILTIREIWSVLI